MELLKLAIVYVIVLLMFYIRYKFPHFCMHFGGGMSTFGVNSFETLSKCQEHTKSDIEKFKKKQLIILILLSVFFLFVFLFSLINELVN